MSVNPPFRAEAWQAAILATLFLGTAALNQHSSFARAEGTQAVVRRVVDPVVELRGKLSHPGRREEALVILDFVLRADGSITDVELSEGGFHRPSFVLAAKKALQQSRIKPMEVDGVPTDSRLSESFVFLMENTNGVQTVGLTKSFAKAIRNVGELMERGDYMEAQRHAEGLLSGKVRLFYEFATVNSALAQIYSANGNPYRALVAGRSATIPTGSGLPISISDPLLVQKSALRASRSGFLLEEPDMVELLKLQMRNAASAGLTFDALTAYTDLTKIIKLPPEDPFRKLADLLRSQLASSEPLIGKIRMEGMRTWMHPLHRRLFTLQNIKGQVTGMGLKCPVRKTEFSYRPGVVWSVSSGSTDCSLVISAPEGSSFDIVELMTIPAGKAPTVVALP